MKLIFKKSDVNEAVSILSKAIPTRTTMSILECIFIDATTDRITFTANDMELGIETQVEGEIIERGTHQQLLKNHSYYYKLYQLQFEER